VAQQEHRHGGAHRLLARDRGDGAGGHVLQFGDPGILQAAIIMRR
jgi:hypothetical protein